MDLEEDETVQSSVHFVPRGDILHHCGTISNLKMDIGPIELTTDLTQCSPIFTCTYLCVYVCTWFYTIFPHVLPQSR